MTICRTPEEAFARGWEDGADDPPLTKRQIARLSVLLAPFLRPRMEDAA